MQRIIVKEQDLTSNVEALSSYDVAYVPGFVSTTNFAEYYRKPTLFTSKYAFVSAFGSTAPTFASAQPYDTTEWSASALGGANQFEAGDADPGFKYAYYLLSLGMPVYFEVMNNSSIGTYTEGSYTQVSVSTFEVGTKYYYHKYTKTTDTEIVDGKTYYTYDEDTGVYTAVTSPKEAELSTYYEQATAYSVETSSTPVQGRTYYTYTSTVAGICTESMYAGLTARFIGSDIDTSFDSVGDYSVKFITTGGYATFEYNDNQIAAGMVNIATNRGDAIALIDHTDNPDRDLFPSSMGGAGDAVIDVIRDVTIGSDPSYSAMFTPWYECSATDCAMPASLAYLSALATQLKNYSPWLAVSGVIRGKVPSITKLHTSQTLTNNIADSYATIPSDTSSTGVTPISINPITYIQGVGNCIWGNRTLRNNTNGTTASSMLNIRSAVSDIKKVLYETSQTMMFEQNTDVTWINYKSSVTPILDRMVANYILNDYSITRYTVNPETGADIPAYEVYAIIRIQPINAIEVFELTVEIDNTEISVSE